MKACFSQTTAAFVGKVFHCLLRAGARNGDLSLKRELVVIHRKNEGLIKNNNNK